MIASAKVIILIVEGNNDADLLTDYLEELTTGHQARYHFEVTCGDILSDEARYATPENRIKVIIQRVMDRQKYRRTDIAKVYQIADVDGCFIPQQQGYFQVDSQLKAGNTHYYDLDGKKVVCCTTRNRRKLEATWRKKQAAFKKLLQLDSIWRFPYALCYFSLTSEHVLAGEIQYNQEDKLDVIDDFIDKHPTVTDFLGFLDEQTVAVPPLKCFDATVLQQEVGFSRCTTINFLFDDIRKLVQ